MPVVASNRIGAETITHQGHDSTVQFYGGSFITDGRGEILQEASADKNEFINVTFDLDKLAIERRQ